MKTFVFFNGSSLTILIFYQFIIMFSCYLVLWILKQDELFIWKAVADSKPPNPLPVKPPTQGGSLPLSFNRGPPGTSYGGGGK